MEIINYNDICFQNLKLLGVKSSESNIYIEKIKDMFQVYKFFKDELNVYALTLKSEKLKLLERKRLDCRISIPNAKIQDRSLLGIREDYIDGVDLDEAFNIYDNEELKNILIEVSEILKSMHNDKIIVSDFNFGNIRIDKQGRPHFLDVLSYSIDNIPANTSSYIINEYLKTHKKKFKPSKNNDNISLILLTIQTFINKYFFDITDYDFDKAKEKIKCLENLEDIFYDLKNSYVKDAPYLHELIK